MSPNTTRLAGRTALVTGSTSGLGAAFAGALADAGAFVVVSGRDHSRGSDVVTRIASGGGSAVFISADLDAGSTEVRRLAEQASSAVGGRIDILINNAAILLAPTPTADVPEQLVCDALAVNVTAPFLLTGIIAPAMVEHGGGSIINIGSINGLIGMSGSALYSATKAALHSLTKSWADEYGPLGVRVNTVAPGPSLTEGSAEFAEYLVPLLARTPSRRASTLAEVAAAVVFLASDDAANIHGTTLSVDGGWSAI
jgi:NAD(P)-dependent dehydrogenase (short-subunit alcohol dehydrogenase family)